MTPLLTIAVPTFNRRVHLERLLPVLSEIGVRHGGRVEILISDNASNDGTADAVLPFTDGRGVRLIRNEENRGPDANIAQCYVQATGRFVWILGDDDMPGTGAIDALLGVLESAAPDLVFLPSEWLPEVHAQRSDSEAAPARFVPLEREHFARLVNVWLTFISGIVVRRRPIDPARLQQFQDTNLIQLAWVLEALSQGEVFGVFDRPVVLATSGNTGGYAVVRVFGVNFPTLVANAFGRGSALYAAIIGPTALGYLPQLVWNVRTGTGGKFAAEFPWHELRRELGRFLSYRVFVEGVGRLPLPLAQAVLLAARASAKLGRFKAKAIQRKGEIASRIASSHPRPNS